MGWRECCAAHSAIQVLGLVWLGEVLGCVGLAWRTGCIVCVWVSDSIIIMRRDVCALDLVTFALLKIQCLSLSLRKISGIPSS